MLKLTIPASEYFDNNTGLFINIKQTTLTLEHSLVSISKWESKHKKPFLDQQQTEEEFIDYIRCMTLTQNVDPNIYKVSIDREVQNLIRVYMQDSMTATTFSNLRKSSRREVITAEIIYYWMISFGIPFECQKWNINRLLALINVCGMKNSKGEKMSRNEIYSQNRALNAARKAKLHTRG